MPCHSEVGRPLTGGISVAPGVDKQARKACANARSRTAGNHGANQWSRSSHRGFRDNDRCHLAHAHWINWHCPYHVVLFSRRGLRTAASRHGFVVSSMSTATPATWWLRQRTHRRPPMGEKGEWTNRRISKAGLAGAGLVCRAGDLLRGNGDMIMAVLTKPEEGK